MAPYILIILNCINRNNSLEIIHFINKKIKKILDRKKKKYIFSTQNRGGSSIWLEYRTVDPGVAGSSPVRPAFEI